MKSMFAPLSVVTTWNGPHLARPRLLLTAVEGWLNSIAAVLNRHLLPRVWALNGFDMKLIPAYVPDTAQRLDLDVLSAFVLRLSQAGMPLFPDTKLESYIRDATGMPDIEEDSTERDAIVEQQQQQEQLALDHQQAQTETMKNPPPRPVAPGQKPPANGSAKKRLGMR
jgi:phage gp29-like protein